MSELKNRPAEQRLLGAIIQQPALLEKIADRVGPGDFSDPRLGLIFSAAARTALKDELTPSRLVEELRQAGELGEVGGDKGILYLADLKVADGEALEAAGTVRNLAKKRDALAAAHRVVGAIADGRDAAADLEAIDKANGEDASGWENLAGIIDAIYAGEHKRLEPTMLARSDGARLLYEGRLNWISAPPESMKSWLAKYACVEQMKLGRPVIYIDFEESDATTCAERIFSLASGDGVERERLRDWMGADGPDRQLFFYRAEGGGFSDRARSQVLRLVKSRQVPLVVLDGFAAAIASHEPPLSEDSARDVNLFLAGLVWPIVSAGAGVLIVDHDAKSGGAAGQTSFQQRSARGSGAKLAAVSGVMLKAQVIKAGSAWMPGEVELWVAKDRPGRIKIAHRNSKRLAGMLVSTPVGDGVVEMTKIEIKSPEELEAEAEAKRWDLIAAEKISKVLEAASGPMSKTEIKETLNTQKKERGGAGWRGETLVAAMRFLVETGWVGIEKEGRSEMLSKLKAYRADFGEITASEAPGSIREQTGWVGRSEDVPF